jgi:hypothetical protein
MPGSGFELCQGQVLTKHKSPPAGAIRVNHSPVPFAVYVRNRRDENLEHFYLPRNRLHEICLDSEQAREFLKRSGAKQATPIT